MRNKPELLITGANGFIGQHLVNFLVGKGYRVVALIRPGSWPAFDLGETVEVVEGDILIKDDLKKILRKGMVVINLAVNSYDVKKSFEVNVGGLSNLIEVAEKVGIEGIIQFGTQATKIRVKGVYAKSKSQADELLQKSKLNWVIIRPSLVYGRGSKGLFNKMRLLIGKLSFLPVFGDGESLVFPVYVEDVCQLVEKVILKRTAWELAYDFGGEALSYNEFYRQIILGLGKMPRLFHVPIWMGIAAGKIFSWLRLKNPPFFVDNVLGSTQKIICQSEKTIKCFGVKPRRLKDGINEVFGGRKVRIIIVGLGKMGMLHLSILAALEEVEVVAIVDSNLKALASIRSMGFMAMQYSSLNEAIRETKAEAVWILTPTMSHLSLTREARAKGLSVLVEKPAAINEDELKEYGKLGGKIAVGYVLLFARGFYKLKELVDGGRYGKIKSFSASYRVGEVLGPKRGWMYEKNRSGGGVVMNPGPHIFSLISWILGEVKIKEARLEKKFSREVEDRALIQMVGNEYRGEVELDWSVEDLVKPEINFEIEMENGRLSSNGREVVIVAGKRTVIAEDEIEPVSEKVFNINRESFGEAYFGEDKEFVDWVAGGKEPRNSLFLAIKAEKMIADIYKFAKANGTS